MATGCAGAWRRWIFPAIARTSGTANASATAVRSLRVGIIGGLSAGISRYSRRRRSIVGVCGCPVVLTHRRRTACRRAVSSLRRRSSAEYSADCCARRFRSVANRCAFFCRSPRRGRFVIDTLDGRKGPLLRNGSEDPLLHSQKERKRYNTCSIAALLFNHRRTSVLRGCAGRRDLKVDWPFPSEPGGRVSAVITTEYSTNV